MTQFENALTIINFKKDLNFETFIKKNIIESTKKTVSGFLSDVVSSVGITLNSLTTGYISDITQEIINQEGIPEDSLDFYQFKINPTSFNFPRQKIMSNVLTGGGWDSDVRGQNMITVSYSCTTGSLIPKNINNVMAGLSRDLISRTSTLFQKIVSSTSSIVSGISPKYNDLIYQLSTNPKLSTRYLKFLLFDIFWRANDDDLLISWEDNTYIGKFVSFDFKPDANRPWEIQYNFTIAVYPDFTYNIYTGSISNDLARIKRRFNIQNDVITTITNNPDNLIEANFDWFTQNGLQVYNKNKLSFLENNNIYVSKDVVNLSPEELAKAYRAQGDFIDIFEEQNSLKMKLDSLAKEKNLFIRPVISPFPKQEQVNKEAETLTNSLP